VWVSSKLFYEKLAKPVVAPTIALRDATSHVYKMEDLAKRSLEGGSPVKGRKENKKDKMTPAKREALLGWFLISLPSSIDYYII
jgi:hypothetical protein